MLIVALTACASTVPTEPAPYGSPVTQQPSELSEPGPIVLETVVSARWSVPLKGLVDLDDPRAAELENGPHDIVLPVHVLTHPEHGAFIVDTGIARETVARGLVASFLKSVDTVEPLADILARQPVPLAGVLLTHTHADHVLGLPDVPANVPVMAGPGDERSRNLNSWLTFSLLDRGLGDRPLSTWGFDEARSLGPIEHALDVFGDGTLFALHVPGHTPGSTAYLARTTEGPVLFTGDCSHTQWGWDHGVAPGTYTEDHDGNVESLAALQSLADAIPGIRVVVGHEL
ncbi:MAG: MBL fold metallo-hydrolase [Myxococcota bacterium]